MAKPAKFPEWASVLQVDDVSGQKNIVEPPTAIKQSGWSYRMKPPRNWDNWFKNLAYQWIDFLYAGTRLLPAASARANARVYQLVPAASAEARGTNATFSPGAENQGRWEWDDDGLTAHVAIPLPLQVGQELKSTTCWVAAPEGTISMLLWKKNLSTIGLTQLGSTQTSSGTAVQSLTVGGLSEIVVTDHSYYVVLTTTAAGGDNLSLFHGAHFSTEKSADDFYDPDKDAWTNLENMTVRFPVPVRPGEKLGTFSARVKNGSGGDVEARLYRQTDGTLTQIGSTVSSTGTASVQTLSHTLASPHEVLDGNSYFVEVIVAPAAGVVYHAKVATVL